MAGSRIVFIPVQSFTSGVPAHLETQIHHRRILQVPFDLRRSSGVSVVLFLEGTPVNGDPRHFRSRGCVRKW